MPMTMCRMSMSDWLANPDADKRLPGTDEVKSATGWRNQKACQRKPGTSRRSVIKPPSLVKYTARQAPD